MLYDRHWSGGTPGSISDPGWVREVLGAAAESGVTLTGDSATAALTARLPSGAQIWITDAQPLERPFTVAEDAGVRRIALWYIGQEDPALWRVIRPR